LVATGQFASCGVSEISSLDTQPLLPMFVAGFVVFVEQVPILECIITKPTACFDRGLPTVPPSHFRPAVLLPSPSSRHCCGLPGLFSSFYFALSGAPLAVTCDRTCRLHSSPRPCGHLLDPPFTSSPCATFVIAHLLTFPLQPSPAPHAAVFLSLPLGISFSLLTMGPLAVLGPPTP
jgi:hypothetical protein